jgi:hypothetical protein
MSSETLAEETLISTRKNSKTLDFQNIKMVQESFVNESLID